MIQQLNHNLERLRKDLHRAEMNLRVAELASSLQENEAFTQLQGQLDHVVERYRNELMDHRDGEGKFAELPPFRQGYARGALSVLDLLAQATNPALIAKHRERIAALSREIASLIQGTGLAGAQHKE